METHKETYKQRTPDGDVKIEIDPDVAEELREEVQFKNRTVGEIRFNTLFKVDDR